MKTEIGVKTIAAGARNFAGSKLRLVAAFVLMVIAGTLGCNNHDNKSATAGDDSRQTTFATPAEAAQALQAASRRLREWTGANSRSQVESNPELGRSGGRQGSPGVVRRKICPNEPLGSDDGRQPDTEHRGRQLPVPDSPGAGLVGEMVFQHRGRSGREVLARRIGRMNFLPSMPAARSETPKRSTSGPPGTAARRTNTPR